MHTITIDAVGEIDMAFMNAADPTGMLRLVDHRVSGNRTVTLLEVPGDDSAPCYQAVNGHFQHVSGPTLEQWYAEQDSRDAAETQRDLCAWAVQ